MARVTKPPELNLWGEPLEEPESKAEIVPLDFESHAVRMVIIKGEPWWVLSDVARVLGYSHTPHASRLLRDKHKGVHKTDTLGGPQELAIVNEAGLYTLILKSNQPEVERFQDWVTDEVLPSIRKTGGYSIKPTRIDKEAKRLKCDPATAKARVDQFTLNRTIHQQMAGAGACPNDYREWHNAGYRGQFGKEAAELRRELGLKSYRDTPLDHMSVLTLSQNHHAKALADRIARESGKSDATDRAELLEITARDIAEADFRTFGPGHGYGVVRDGRRGPVLDIVRQQIEAETQ
jgi:prophage antirepressor-like protein